MLITFGNQRVSTPGRWKNIVLFNCYRINMVVIYFCFTLHKLLLCYSELFSLLVLYKKGVLLTAIHNFQNYRIYMMLWC